MHRRHHSATRGAALLGLIALAACSGQPSAGILPSDLQSIQIPARPDPPGLLGVLIDRLPPPVTVRANASYPNPLGEPVAQLIAPDIADQMVGTSFRESLDGAARQSLALASLNATAAPTGKAIAWESEDAQGHPAAGGSVVPVRNIYRSHRGLPCRDLQQHVQTPNGGASEQVTLCRNDMGDNRVLWLPGSPD